MKKKTFKTMIGGQAVIEGIMMRGPEKSCLAVRKQDGEIYTEMFDTKKSPVAKIPIIRGAVAMIESMIVGVKYINRSAEVAYGADYEKTKFDIWMENKLGKKFSDGLSSFAAVVGALLAIVLFLVLPTVITGAIGGVVELGGFKSAVEGLLKVVIFIGYLFAVTRIKDIHRVFEYHGAEHKTITCYERGEELTVENARGCSRFHPRCGTSFLFIVVIVSIIIFSFVTWDSVSIGGVVISATLARTLLKILMLPLIMGISYELIKLAGRYDSILTKIISAPGLWVQRLTAFEPDDSMLEVAITAFKAVQPENREDGKW